jgi:hypothetical protein
VSEIPATRLQYSVTEIPATTCKLQSCSGFQNQVYSEVQIRAYQVSSVAEVPETRMNLNKTKKCIRYILHARTYKIEGAW